MTLGTLFPKTMGSLAYKLWFIPARFKTPYHEQDAERAATRFTMNAGAIPVSVLSWGKGPAILFVHGWMGRGTQAGYFYKGLATAGYRLISFDAPAHGQTPGKQTSLFEIADVIHELDRQHGPFEAAITHSFGGMTLAYAMKQGLSTGKVVNICPIADLDTLIGHYRQKMRIPGPAIKAMLQKLQDTYGADMAENISTTNNVRGLPASALVIHDEDDGDIPWQSGRTIAQAWKNADFILTRGLGHRRILRDPEIVKKTVEFIATNNRE